MKRDPIHRIIHALESAEAQLELLEAKMARFEREEPAYLERLKRATERLEKKYAAEGGENYEKWKLIREEFEPDALKAKNPRLKKVRS